MFLLTAIACNYGLVAFNPEDGGAWDGTGPGQLEGVGADGGAGSGSGASGEDRDGDGYPMSEGDCNDSDPSIHPGQPDVCDSVDNDCDGQLDEDAGTDPWETYDDSASFAGEYVTAGSFRYEGAIQDASDTDRYQFYITDPPGGYFQIRAELYPLSGETDYVVDLSLVENVYGNGLGLLQTSDSGSYGESESIVQQGTAWYDDGGLYEFRIYSKDGSGCDATYELAVEFSN